MRSLAPEGWHGDVPPVSKQCYYVKKQGSGIGSSSTGHLEYDAVCDSD